MGPTRYNDYGQLELMPYPEGIMDMGNHSEAVFINNHPNSMGAPNKSGKNNYHNNLN